ncbi:response regulator [Aliirhizobium terrae]|uniref:response regulator n=1 Tax=Terrirhizobium terrae TaxID=2926709 RepID=UPI002577F6D9|nr:response regulator [Rhizobium sp. CC-CFT758]WJH40347.1 response regulator [Rhizobium sp. CC-CFT758]
MSEAEFLNDCPNILLLEDDLLLAMDMEDHLLKTGHKIVGPFGRIADAMDAIPRNDLAGAIVDLNLHGELSFPVIEMLQQHSVPVIVCSGYAEIPEIKGQLEGMAMLSKPWNAQKLDRLMRETFGVKNSA